MAQNANRRRLDATPAALDVSLTGDIENNSADGDRRLVLTPRAAWLLSELKKAGAKGITSISYPGVRVADAVYKLRRAGYAVSTEFVGHSGPFPGKHAVYRLGGADG